MRALILAPKDKTVTIQVLPTPNQGIWPNQFLSSSALAQSH